MSLRFVFSPLLPVAPHRLCRSAFDVPIASRLPLHPAAGPSSINHLSHFSRSPSRPPYSRPDAFSFSSTSSVTSIQSTSHSLHDQERVAGWARLVSVPSLTDNAHDLPPELKSLDPISGASPMEPRIQITEAAAQRIRYVQATDKQPGLVLRLAVESGGCHGFQYKMSFSDAVQPDDYLFTDGGEARGLVAIDRSSLDLMNGSTIDFATELIGSSFRVLDNPNAAGPGCGCGVSWELK